MHQKLFIITIIYFLDRSPSTMDRTLVQWELVDGEKMPLLSNRCEYVSLSSKEETEPLMVNHTTNGSASKKNRGICGPRPTSLPQCSKCSLHKHRLNQWLKGTISILVLMVLAVAALLYWYFGIHAHQVQQQQMV